MTTTVAVGSVSVSTSGTLTGQLLETFASALSVSSATTVTAITTAGTTGAPITLPASPSTGSNSLIIPTSDTGVISVPSGYQFVVYQGTGSLVGGDSSTVIIGDLNYAGGAGTVIGTGTQSGTVVDTTPGATFAMATGSELVFGLASAQSFRFDSGYSTLVSAGSGQSVSVDSSASVIGFYTGTANFMQTGGAETMYAGPGVSTVDATAGNTVFFGSNAGDMVSLGSGTGEVLDTNETGAGAGMTTVMAGTGSDTIFAQGGVDYTGSTGKSLFIGGPGHSTVYTAANETAYGGTGGEVVSIAAGSKLLFLGGGGADTLMGGTVAPTVWGNVGENLTVADSVSGGLYVMYGSNDQMNLTSTGGAAHIVAIDGGPFAGNATLTMSNAGGDALVLFSPAEFGLTAVTHTLTVANWQASDLLDLTFTTISGQEFGYSQANATAAQTALASGSSFTLSDGTTVVFQGAKPTTVAHI